MRIIIKRYGGDWMSHCTNCHAKWKVKDVLALGFSKKGKACPSCRQKQTISAETQRMLTLGFWSLLIVPFLLFSIKFSDEDEPML